MNTLQNQASSFSAPTNWEETKALNAATTALLQKHMSKLARNKYKALHGMLDESKPDSWYIAQMDEPAPDTVKKYMGSGQKQVQAAIAGGISPWDVIERDAGSKNSWNTRRAALQYYLALRIRELKRRIDKISSGAVTPSEMKEVLSELPILATALRDIPTAAPSKFTAGSGFKPVRMSKARSLRNAPVGWDIEVGGRLSKKYAPFWLVQCVTGCRPAELRNGFALQKNADGNLIVTILGAKVGKRSGQTQRTLLLKVGEGDAVAMLAARLKSGTPVQGRLQCSGTSAYSKAIKRACENAFPGLGLSAYSARHQKKADWRKAGLTRVELAKAMGHRTTRSAAYYGRAVRGRSGAVKPLAIQATHTVKIRAHFVPTASNAGTQSRPTSGSSRKRRSPRPR